MSHSSGHEVNTGVLLAGGAARRAGVDKRYLVLAGQTLLQRNLDFLRSIFPEVVLSLRTGQQADLGDAGPATIVPDLWPESSALVGIASALTRYRRPIFVLAADIAFPDPTAVARLLAAFPGHAAAVPVVDGRYEPLCAVYGPECLAVMAARLDAGRHRLVDVLADVDAAAVPFADAGAFLNVNTPDTYAAAAALATRRRTGESAGPAAVTAAPDAAGMVAAPPAAGPAVLAVIGWSGSGKTTLIERLLPELIRLGLTVGTVKHDVHGFSIDHPGKDSWRHARAGARAYAIASPTRLAFVTQLDGDLPLAGIVAAYFGGVDLVLAEGYKHSARHRLEVFRAATGHDGPICTPGESLALVTDAALRHPHRFALDEVAGLAHFIAARLDTLRRG